MCAMDRDRNTIGKETNNSIADTRLYEVEYIDGTIETLVANVIAKNIFLQVDEEGHRQLLMEKS